MAVFSRIAPLALSALVGGACQDASTMFGGVWETPEPFTSALYAGKVSLAIGHFGREMTGVVHLLDKDGFELDACPCAFLEQEDLDLGTRAFVLVSQRCQDVRWIWRLVLDTRGPVEVLTGTVEAQGAAETVPLRLELVDRFVSDQDKECAQP